MAILQEFRRSRSEPGWVVQRAAVIVWGFEKWSNQEIAAEVRLDRMAVGRRRAAWDELTLWECTQPQRLREAIRETLRDAPRSGCPGTITGEQVTQILAVACEPPEQSGRPITHWTHKELRDEVIKRVIISMISESQVGRYLKAAVLRPHRQKMWLNTTEKDPVVFEQRVSVVCETYREAPARHAADGTRTVCTDEMTGLQALERNAPDKPPRVDQIAQQEFEYTRHGTTTLIGNWDVVAGIMLAETIGPTRTEAEYVAHIDQTVATDPDVPWIFLQDNLNIHWSASLVEWIAQTCGLEEPLGGKREVRNPAQPSLTPQVSVWPQPPYPLRLHPQTQLVVESGGGPLRNSSAQSHASRELHLVGRPRRNTKAVLKIL